MSVANGERDTGFNELLNGQPLLRAQDLTDSSTSFSIYLIDGFPDDEGTLGIAGGLSGLNGVPSTPVSRLGHTIEDDGMTSFPIRNLDSCARSEIGSSEPSECPDGRNLMF